jgi:peptide/nickel transport system substrate-binding protein
MKLNRVTRAIALVAVSAMAVTGITVAPASASARDVVRFAESNSPTSLNPNHRDHNLVSNGTINYLTSTGFNYYNDKGQLVKRPGFGKYQVLSRSPLKIKYTVNPGQVWSDGAPLDAFDLMIGWVANSGLYDNAASGVNWQTVSKGGSLAKITKFPVIADGGRSMTVTYNEFVSDWEVQIGLGRPVHALTQLAFPTDTNQAAKARFMKAVRDKNWPTLKRIADQWNTAYHILRSPGVTASTNPKLLVASGAYRVQSSVPNQSVTLVRNDRYKAGPKPAIKTFQIRVIDDATAAAQALINGQVDVINPSATAALVQLLKGASSRVTLRNSPAATYELIYAKYDGAAWRGMSEAKANDLRRAFLLTVPRQEMVEKLIDPVSPGAKTLDSITPYFGTSPFYKRMLDGSGIKPFLGTETARLAEARRLLAKHGYSTSNPFKVKVMWGLPSNERRSGQMALITAAAAKVGIDAESFANANWSTDLNSPVADFQFHAYAQTSSYYTGLSALWGFNEATNTFRPGNRGKWKNLKTEEALQRHFKDLTPEQAFRANLAFEQEWYKDAVGLPLFQFPGITAHSRNLKGVSPAPFSPNVVWNFWTWKF